MTWAFVGRWWEAPPWPLARNAKQHCHCLMSGAADACAACFSGNQEQKQSPPPHPPHPPPSTAHIHASPTCFSEPHSTSGLHTLRTTGAVARRSAAFSRTPDLRGLQRARGQTSGDTPAVCFHLDTENRKQRNVVYDRVRIGETTPGSQDETKSCHFSVNTLIRLWNKVLLSGHAHLWFCWM